MNLNLIQRQRVKIYKQQLKDQFQNQKMLRVLDEVQKKHRERQQIEKQREYVIQQEKLKRQKSKQLYSQLTNENKFISQTKNYNSYNDSQIKSNKSLLDQLYNNDHSRIKNWKQHSQQMKAKNFQVENIHKQLDKKCKNLQKKQEQIHLHRLKQLEDIRKRQYYNIKNKHLQDMQTFERHKKLIQLNEQYKKSLQDFAYKDKDILDNLRRNDQHKIRQMKKYNQNQLKSQIYQKRSQSSFQKSQNLQKGDLQKSIFKDILFRKNTSDKKQYEKQLLSQIRQKQKKKQEQSFQIKKKIQIGSIYGGVQGEQRLKMIKIVDQNLGIKADYLKQMSSSKYNPRINHDHLDKRQKQKNLVNKIQDELFNPEKKSRQIVQINKKQKINFDLSKSYNFGDNSPKTQTNETLKNSLNKISVGQTQRFVTYDTITGKQKMYEF